MYVFIDSLIDWLIYLSFDFKVVQMPLGKSANYQPAEQEGNNRSQENVFL